MALKLAEEVNNTSSEPNEKHHAHLYDGVDIPGERDVATNLSQLEDGEEEGQEVQDPRAIESDVLSPDLEDF